MKSNAFNTLGLGFLLTALVLAGFNFTSTIALRRQGAYIRFEPSPPAEFDLLGRKPLPVPAEATLFLSRLKSDARLEPDAGRGPRSVKGILKWTMDRTAREEVVYPPDVTSALKLADNGNGLSCGPLALIFHTALRSFGFQTRIIQLARSPLNDIDTHVTVEALVDGRWVIFDPTFHVSYADASGKLLGAAEVRDAFLQNPPVEVRPVFYGPVRFPARLESHNVNWRTLFQHVAYLDEATGSPWNRLPPFRYWNGPVIRYLESASRGIWIEPVATLATKNVMVRIPIAIAIAGMLGLVFLFLGRRTRAKSV